MKRLNPYWAQEQTLRQAQGKTWKSSYMNFAYQRRKVVRLILAVMPRTDR